MLLPLGDGRVVVLVLVKQRLQTRKVLVCDGRHLLWGGVGVGGARVDGPAEEDGDGRGPREGQPEEACSFVRCVYVEGNWDEVSMRDVGHIHASIPTPIHTTHSAPTHTHAP